MKTVGKTRSFICVSDRAKHLPGESGVWVFVLGDMLIFSLLFCSFLYYRATDVATYVNSQASLNQSLGAINTILLLTSSLFVALGLIASRKGMIKRCSEFLVLALLCGFGFAVIKVFEYAEKIGESITVVTNEFYMFYYILTAIHFLHVMIGMGVLVYLILHTRKRIDESVDYRLLESGASYWHMVDLLWIVIFPLLYLMK